MCVVNMLFIILVLIVLPLIIAVYFLKFHSETSSSSLSPSSLSSEGVPESGNAAENGRNAGKGFRRTFSLPFVGYLPFLTSHPHKKFHSLSKELGPVFWTKLGGRHALVLNDQKSIIEMYKKEESLGRPRDISFNVLINLEGLGMLSGSSWKEQKRFTMTQLRNHGFGRPITEKKILQNCRTISDKIDRIPNRICTIRELFDIDDFIVTSLLGLKFHSEQNRLIKQCIRNAIRSLGQVSLITFFPRVTRFLSCYKLSSIINQLKYNFQCVNQYVKASIDEHERRFKEVQIALGCEKQESSANEKDTNEVKPLLQKPDNYIDSFLIEMRSRKMQNSFDSISNYEKKKIRQNNTTTFTRNMLAGNVQGFLAAGIETVLTTIEWSFLILATRPDIQARAQQEIDSVVGSLLYEFDSLQDEKLIMQNNSSGKQISGSRDLEEREKNVEKEKVQESLVVDSLIDRNKLPYCWAMIMEIERWKTISPIALARETINDFIFRGVSIPKGTMLLANLYAVHHDPMNWIEPEKFNPERFLLPTPKGVSSVKESIEEGKSENKKEMEMKVKISSSKNTTSISHVETIQNSHIDQKLEEIKTNTRSIDKPEEMKHKLTTSQQQTQSIRAWMPFSIGKRSCPGESVAQMEILLHLVYLLNKYNIHLAPTSLDENVPVQAVKKKILDQTITKPEVDIEPLFRETLGLTLMPEIAAKLYFEKRTNKNFC